MPAAIAGAPASTSVPVHLCNKERDVGCGCMIEYLVCRTFADARVQRIDGGSNEIMKGPNSRSV